MYVDATVMPAWYVPLLVTYIIDERTAGFA